MVAYAGHILESTKGIEIKLVIYIMLIKGSAEDKNHNPIVHFTWIISPFFHKRLFSLSCLGVQVVFDGMFCLL